jgi:hypothetical protein
MFLLRVKIDQVVIMTLKLGVTFVTFPPIYFQLIFVLSLSDSSNSGIREFKQKNENWNNGNKDSPRAANKRCSTQSNLSEFQADFLLFMRFMLFNSPKLMPSRILKMAKRKKKKSTKQILQNLPTFKSKVYIFFCVF